MGDLEVGEPGWREAGWAEAAGQHAGTGSEQGQAPQVARCATGLTRGLPKIDVEWEEVQHALRAWQEEGVSAGEGPELGSPRLLAQEWDRALKDEEFVAGVPNSRLKAWERYFVWAQGQAPLTAEQQKVLNWLRHGIKLEWVGADSKTQSEHPRYQDRKQQVVELLKTTLPGQGQRVRELLQGDRPGKVQFANRKSVELHAEFVKASLEDLLHTGALMEVTGDKVQVCSGLGVVANRKGKLRLILDARYINLFDKYVSFTYEKLTDVPQYARPGDWLCLTDFKAGYHHFRVHKEDQKYLGLSFQGKFFVFTVLPFGLSSACRTYTRFMLQVYAPLRERGLRMTTFVDDAIFLAASRMQGWMGMRALLLLLTYLGFCLSRSKCVSEPAKKGQYLGLIVDLEEQAFQVPQDKAEFILEEIGKVRTAGGTKRDMARLAGMLVSVAPAVRLAPLYIRRLFQAMGELREWGESLTEELAALTEEDLLYWVEALERQKGKPWRQEGPVFVCYGDASARGYGGFSEELLLQPMQESFTAEEQEFMSKGTLSSCHREVKNICLLVRTCIRANTDKLRGAVLLVFCDNQGAVSNVNSMNGKTHTLKELRLMFEAAAEVGVEVRAQWVPRDTPEIQVADLLSRCDDASDFALDRGIYTQICKTGLPEGGIWGFPTGDCFAGTVDKFHQVKRYFTRYPAAEGMGADALVMPWSLLDPTDGTPLLWVFPPRECLREVIAKVAQERKNCILVVCNRPAKWKTWLLHLPVRAETTVPPRKHMFVLGSRFPPHMLQDGDYQCHLTCSLILFEKPRRPASVRGAKRRRTGTD
eukprot:jgi/Botrbrau1/656/Bobra.0161s0044.1